MDCNWCICGCGQQVYDAQLYSSPECKNMDTSTAKKPITQMNTPPDSPNTQLNMRFSIALANSAAFHEHDSQKRLISPPSSTASSYDSNSSMSTIDRQYHRHQRNESLGSNFSNANDHDHYYCSTSVPIDIPKSYSHADESVMEINKGTFGKDNYL